MPFSIVISSQTFRQSTKSPFTSLDPTTLAENNCAKTTLCKDLCDARLPAAQHARGSARRRRVRRRNPRRLGPEVAADGSNVLRQNALRGWGGRHRCWTHPRVPAYGVGVQKTDLFSLLLNTASQPSMAEVLAMSTATGSTVSPSRPAASTGKTV